MKLKSRPHQALKRIAAAVLATGLTVTVAACAEPARSTPAEYISYYGSEPQNPLIPTNTSETGGGEILRAIFSGLVDYDKDGKTYNLVAESITANDNSTEFTIKIAPGWTFTNGEAVTSDNFIQAWNYGANPENAQLGADFFASIKGYEEFSEGAADHLTGLEKISDSEFKVTLSNPESTWPDRLGYQAYVPLPSVAFEDMEAFGQSPIGNGPYMLDGKDAWVHNVNINLKKNPDYHGPDKPKNAGMSFVFYTNLETAYADMQAGDLDSMRETVSPNAYPSYEADFPDSHSADPMSSIETFGIPYTLEHFGADEEGTLRRQAISQAIDRDLITDKLFFGARTPAEDFGSPTLGNSTDIEGNEVLTFNQQRAKELWAQADAIRPYSGGPFQIAYNADGGHQQWVEAVTNSIRQTLGIPAQGKAYPNFKGFRDDIVNENVNAAYRSGWLADYPSIANFLEAQYRSSGSSNDTGYANPEFDALLSKAASQSNTDEANKIYHQAQVILMQDLPQIPLWYKTASTAWNPDLKNFSTSWNGMPAYTQVEKPQGNQGDEERN